MIKHGASHAGVALVSMMAGALLVDAVKQTICDWSVTRNLMALFWQQAMRWHLDPDNLLRLVLIAFLGFIWGVAFKIAHSEQVIARADRR